MTRGPGPVHSISSTCVDINIGISIYGQCLRRIISVEIWKYIVTWPHRFIYIYSDTVISRIQLPVVGPVATRIVNNIVSYDNWLSSKCTLVIYKQMSFNKNNCTRLRVFQMSPLRVYTHTRAHYGHRVSTFVSHNKISMREMPYTQYV